MRCRPTIYLSAIAALLLTSTDPASAGDPKPRRPNIIFILADDLGWTDLGCQGSKYYETPNIDRLAAGGLRFTSHYHSQNCAPTRACLMTGQYAPRTGVYTVGTLERGLAKDRKMVVPANVVNLPLDRATVADALKGSGYATGIFGKWHLGQKGPYHPGKRGFDEAITTMGKHFDFVTQPPVDYPKGVYLADWLTDRAVDFIERHKSEPFFLYVSHFGVHSPFQAKKELIARFQKKAPVEGHRDPVYAAMIASVDESVGRILAKLDELKLSEDTIVIFASDNGGVGGYAEIGGRGVTANAPLRGGKGMLYEGGVRVPFIVRWPRRIKGGGLCHEPTTHIDIFPTFLEMAGVKERPRQPIDGVSIVPLLANPAAKLPREAIYAHFPGYLEGYGTKQWRTTPVGFIRAGDWKLMEFYEDGRLELYNLKDDLGEKNNLAVKMPEKARELQTKLAAWRQELKAAMPRLRVEGDPPGKDSKKGKTDDGEGADAVQQDRGRLRDRVPPDGADALRASAPRGGCRGNTEGLTSSPDGFSRDLMEQSESAMNAINLDTQDEAVKRFFLALPIEPGGSVITLNGHAFVHVLPVGTNTGSAATEDGAWTDAKNSRRCDLIDKEIEGTIAPEEVREVYALQQEMLRYRRRVAPLPLEDARRLHQELLP
jgi:arylsulfatase A-like enzyme